MRSKTHISSTGFIAMITVVLLTAGIFGLSMVTLASALMYSDMVERREIRIQTRFNLIACLDTVDLMIAKDYLIVGTSSISEFGCNFQVDNDFVGHTFISAEARMGDIGEYGSR